MNYELTGHAREVLQERQISIEWLEQAFTAPELTLADPKEAGVERRYRKIPQFGNRVLRVVVNTAVAPPRVVSVYFDRTMKGKL